MNVLQNFRVNLTREDRDILNGWLNQNKIPQSTYEINLLKAIIKTKTQSNLIKKAIDSSNNLTYLLNMANVLKDNF